MSRLYSIAPDKKPQKMHTLASNVFPVPCSLYKMTPLGGLIPISAYDSKGKDQLL